MVNYDQRRWDMVETQLVARGVKDLRVLDAMRKIPRHQFVDQALQERAYEDHPLPIGEGQTISQPYMVAVMTEALSLKGKERVLEVGTGSGYQTAILAELSARVFSVERFPSLARQARSVLDQLGYSNVAIHVGDGSLGWSEFAPYDRILVTAGAPEIPKTLPDQLAEGGILAIPIGSEYSQVLTIVEKVKGKIRSRPVLNCVFVPLVGKYGWVSENNRSAR